MNIGAPGRVRPIQPCLQTMRVPNHADVDFKALRKERLERLQSMMRKHQFAVCLFYTPANIRYATGVDVMGGWTSLSFARYALAPASGEPILFEYKNSMHVAQKYVRDVRPALTWQYGASDGLRRALTWAQSIKDTLAEMGLAGETLAVDRLDAFGFMALTQVGIAITDTSPVTVDAREVKTPEEIKLMLINGAIGDAMMAAFADAVRPGIREYELLAVLNHALFNHHGEAMFTRLVSSGPNTNPWMSEAHDKMVQPGDLVGVDTDAYGYEGYVIDFSRTFLCGEHPTEGQKEAYRVAYDCVNGMRELMQPGMEFIDFAHAAPALPPAYTALRYSSMCHQAGLEDEGPGIIYPDQQHGPKGKIPEREIKENMVFCLECYAGKEGAPYGVKLEDQVLVTKAGALPLMTYPFEEKLLRASKNQT